MKQTVDIQFLGTPASSAVEAVAREKVRKLDQFCAHMISCRVRIELVHKHRHQGRPFAVHIELALPGQVLAISRVHDEDVYIALRAAFDGMKRQIEDAVRRDRDHRKQPAAT
ncbi:ribosomal subunit interface protein [Variovorax sp. PBS-H4]|uniref:HPF/RaiA family ribosome-associated protein n=1 Tax=Variovorax sp. PBS-H4 TaxID=434008 RepID=UPI001316F949|nr:HPF/RaiA family ribosome-associated protein [Variovorax sp. PBS-H4]VTU36361.1 ribosomal subunit interface protein [Variovorax sp. PBS-H4]